MKLIAFALVGLLPLFVDLQTIIPGYHTCLFNQLDNSAIDIYDARLTPVPIVPTKTHNIAFGARFKRRLNGPLITNMNIKACIPRSLCVPLPCIPIGNVSFGTCNNVDLCNMIETMLPESFNPENCSPDMLQWGIDCRCPFNFKDNIDIDIFQNITIPSTDLSPLLTTLVLNKTLIIDIAARDLTGTVGRINITFGSHSNVQDSPYWSAPRSGKRQQLRREITSSCQPRHNFFQKSRAIKEKNV